MKTITREEWRKAPRAYRSGDPRKGTAMLLYADQAGAGTVFGPVQVLGDDGKPIGPKARQDAEPR